MKINAIIHRYLFRELIPPFLINLVFFSFVFLMHRILDIANMIVNYQVSGLAFGLMLLYSMPYFLVYIIPMSVMMSVLLTFIRMAGDSEITALKAGGVSLYQLLPPVICFGSLCTALAVFMAVYGMPWGANAYRMLALDVAQSSFDVGLQEKQFNDSFEGVTFYVNQITPKEGRLRDVFIEDQRRAGISSTVVAPRGHIFESGEKYSFVLRLYDGTINQVDLDSRQAHTIRFDTYDLHLDLKNAVSDLQEGGTDEKEMRYEELTAAIEQTPESSPHYCSLLLELHKKFAIPFAGLALAVLGVPLGVRSASNRRSAGLGIGLFAFFLYYLLLSGGMVLAEAGICSPAAGMWAPNGITGAAGVYLLIKAANDRPVRLVHAAGGLFRALARTFAKSGQLVQL
ncbi:MAG TPA: LPS export ABC transporter permease LptF [Desulfosalsimonadaceae bacterium]|nr:LPS export ABC transporter permease LptF [Desulfosalsimonadaceae bacterium]